MGSLYNPNGDPNGVYIGSGNNLQFLQGGSVDQVFLNSSGDFAWIDGRDEEIFEAVDTSKSMTTARAWHPVAGRYRSPVVYRCHSA